MECQTSADIGSSTGMVFPVSAARTGRKQTKGVCARLRERERVCVCVCVWVWVWVWVCTGLARPAHVYIQALLAHELREDI